MKRSTGLRFRNGAMILRTFARVAGAIEVNDVTQDTVRMAKVVTERPRRGHGNKSKKTTGLPIRRYDPDADYDEPVRLPIARRRQYGWDAKDFSDLINPLKRFLRSCIGRPWNKVHSELSQKLDRRSISGCHIWDHVMLEIETDCYIGPDRLAYSNNRKYGHGEWPIDGLYVDPRTGLIREQRPKWRGPSRVSRPLSISTVIAAPPTDDGN